MSEEKLKFPLTCQFRIIAEGVPKDIQKNLQQELLKLKITVPVLEQNQSKGGRYQSFSVDLQVDSQEMMNQIDRVLRAVPGVRMLL